MFFTKKIEKQTFDATILILHLTPSELKDLKNVLGISLDTTVTHLNISTFPRGHTGQFEIQLC